MEPAPGHNPATRVIGGIVFVAALIGLTFQLVDPFEGRPLAYVGRIIGPVVTLLMGGHLFLQRRPHPLFSALIVVLSVLSLVFVVLGHRQ